MATTNNKIENNRETAIPPIEILGKFAIGLDFFVLFANVTSPQNCNGTIFMNAVASNVVFRNAK